MNTEQATRMRTGKGFIAALDQSGGSTPKALKLYGIDEGKYSTDEQMFDLVHQMRTRIMTSPAFTGERILGAILFERTMDSQVEGVDTATYLWQTKQVVPFLKVDKGLADEADQVRLMKPMPELDALLDRAVDKGIFGTKMRSVILGANEAGIKAIVDQQFEVGGQIGHKGLVPIIEPEVDINIADKAEAEVILKRELLAHLDALPEQCPVMLKLTIPSKPDFYADVIAHPRVMRVVALSGGYSRAQSNELLAENHGLIASFSRALSEGLSAQQSDEEFNDMLNDSIESIYRASLT